VFPKFSILDPETLYTLPERQITNGIIDTFVHVAEQYLTKEVNSPLQDRQSAAILSTLVEVGPQCLAPKKDYDAYANFMWCATSALNGVIGCGVVHDWATHGIGHEITALHGLDHAQTLAIVLPSLLRHELQHKKTKLAHLGRHVFHLHGSNDETIAREAIEHIERFFHSVGGKTRLSDYKIPASSIPAIAERAVAVNDGKPLGENRALGRSEIEAILKMAQ
jgi:NADP-dependent alcohol dehydrogenase